MYVMFFGYYPIIKAMVEKNSTKHCLGPLNL